MKGGRRCRGVDDGVGIGGGRWRELRKEDEDGGWFEVGRGWVKDWWRLVFGGWRMGGGLVHKEKA
jgi:hypothetical protein